MAVQEELQDKYAYGTRHGIEPLLSAMAGKRGPWQDPVPTRLGECSNPTPAKKKKKKKKNCITYTVAMSSMMTSTGAAREITCHQSQQV